MKDIANNASTIFVLWISLTPDTRLDKLKPGLCWLDTEERATYERYQVDFKKIEFLAGRILCKSAIGRFLSVSPRHVRFTKNAYGKPVLDTCSTPLHFDLSHTPGMVTCAVSRYGEIGVDVEGIRQDAFTVIPYMFLPEEINAINAQQGRNAQLQALYTLWTRKESVMKAVGQGFFLAPLSFAVPLNETKVRDGQFDYYTFAPHTNYILSVACRRQSTSVRWALSKLELIHLLDEDWELN